MKKQLLIHFIRKWKSSARFRRNAIIFAACSFVIVTIVSVTSVWLAYSALKTAYNWGSDPTVQTQIVSQAENLLKQSDAVTTQAAKEIDSRLSQPGLVQSLISVNCWNKAFSLLNPFYVLGKPLINHFEALKEKCLGISAPAEKVEVTKNLDF
jgi:hypothetical protein